VRLEVRQAWQDLATARARQDTAQASLVSAREALRITEERFQQGLDKMIDLQKNLASSYRIAGLDVQRYHRPHHP